MSEYSANIKLRADRSGLTGEIKIATADIAKLNDELQKSAKDGESGAAGIRKHSEETSRAAGNTRRMSTETKSLREQMTSLKGVIATLGLYKLGSEATRLLAQFQDTRTMLQGLTDTSREYAETQGYLVDVSDRYSGNLNSIAESYGRLLALKQADIITTAESRDLLEGMLDAGAQLKASNEQLGLVYYGLSQALGQSRVQAQELNQVVEPLPGLLNHLGEAAGMTGYEFRQMVMDGEVTSQFFKENMVAALGAYEGAAERTYRNISSISTRISSQHQLLAAQLEAPIDGSVGALLSGYESGIKALNASLPTLVELLSDLATITAVVAGVALSAWLYGIVAGSIAAHGSLTLLELRMTITMGLAYRLRIGLDFLGRSMTALGGPAGVVLIAATAILTFGNRSDEAARRTSILQGMVESLSDSLANMTVADIDAQLAEANRSLTEAQSVLDGLQAPESPEAWDALVTVGDAEALDAYNQRLLELGELVSYWSQHIAQLEDAKADAVERSTKAQEDAAAQLTEKQQELLDKYLPLQKITRDYQSELALLNSIETDSTESAQNKASAIAVLNEWYKTQVADITGVTEAEEEARVEREKTLQQIDQLIQTYAPLQNAQAVYMEQLTLLSQAHDEGLLSFENFQIAVARLAESYDESINPGKAVVDQLEEELAALQLTADELAYYNLTRNLSVEQLELHGDAIRDLVVQLREEREAISETERTQQEYSQRTETLLDDLQRTWADYFDEVLENGKFTFETLGDSILSILRSTMARVLSLNLTNAFSSAITTSASGSGGAETGAQGTTSSWSDLASVFGSGIVDTLSASIVQTSAPIYEGGQLISEGAKTLDFSLSNIGTNLMAGFAGAQIGTAAGEAVFDKTAQSNWGATIGAVLGSFIPGVGTFLGALAGGALDALFGGDGYKRVSVGFDTGRDSVRDKYYQGTETFSSGLVVNKINRRGDAETMNAIVAKAAEIDSFITSATRQAGGSLNMAGMNISGTNGDYGRDNGTFIGFRGGEDFDTEADVDALFSNFAQQLIANVEGLSEGVTNAIQTATGSADEVLQQFQDALLLDRVVKSGVLDVYRDNISFEFSQELVDAAGGMEQLNAITSVFSQVVADSAEVQEDVVDRLKTAVTQQFEDLDLSISDFTSIDDFKDYFDEVKDTLNATDLLKLVQAGNALALLIQQEEQLAEVRSESMSDQIDSVEDLLDTYKSVRTQANALAGTIQNDIYRLTDAPATDLRSRLGTGSFEDQLDVVEQLRIQILDNYNEELRIKQQLHDETLRQYEAQIDAARRIDDYIKGVMTGNLSPLSVADRLALAQTQFDDVVDKARAGDSVAAQNATRYFDSLVKLNQQANASSVEGVELFYTNLAKLESLGIDLSATPAPGEFDSSAIAAPYVDQLIDLQDEVVRIQNETTTDLILGLSNIEILIEDLPEELALRLASLLPTGVANALQVGTNLGILSEDIRDSLGLLPQATDLSSTGIANSIEALTQLSQHPELLAGNITSLVDVMEILITQMLEAGVPGTLLADLIAQNPTATEATNTYLANNDWGTLTDYQSANNAEVTDDMIVEFVNWLQGQPLSEEEFVSQLMSKASELGVGSLQIANATGYSQSDLLAWTSSLGYASFDVGTDRVSHDQFANIHKDEVIFTAAEGNALRRAVVEKVTNSGEASDIAALVRAVTAQSELLERLVAISQQMSSDQQQALSSVSAEIVESVDRLTREIEEIAA
ncbi:MAG: tape measure protein [Pseudohongiellaceae bacterium]|nr:tape measure protein [Pseudohongiellaceae bacterium]